MIGKIQRVPLRAVWPNEALDFTPWLQGNIEILNDVIDLTLTAAEREQAAGTFSVDLVAESESGTVIIENQLEKSDHDHMGKLLTYLVAYDATAAIWITPDPRPEHISVINWLNETSAASFYLIKVEAIQIDDSPPAPLFTRIVGPTIEARQVGETKKELAERHYFRRDFWQELLDRAREKTKLHTNVSPSSENWLGAGSGKSGVSFVYVILQKLTRVTLSIDTGDAEENRRIFGMLHADKETIEEAFGGELKWDIVEGRRYCAIYHVIEKGGYKDVENWPEIQQAMIEAMVRLEKALRPYISKL